MSTETVTQATPAVPTRGRFGEYGGRYVPEVLTAHPTPRVLPYP